MDDVRSTGGECTAEIMGYLAIVVLLKKIPRTISSRGRQLIFSDTCLI